MGRQSAAGSSQGLAISANKVTTLIHLIFYADIDLLVLRMWCLFCLSERPGLVTGKYDVQIMIISAFVALNKSIFSGTSYTVT
jgi:hypothetical protein